MVSFDRWNDNTLEYPSGRICVSNETENLNLNVLNMTTRIIELKTLNIFRAILDVNLMVKNVMQIKSGIKMAK